jgi:hypothetical protein
MDSTRMSNDGGCQRIAVIISGMVSDGAIGVGNVIGPGCARGTRKLVRAIFRGVTVRLLFG